MIIITNPPLLPFITTIPSTKETIQINQASKKIQSQNWNQPDPNQAKRRKKRETTLKVKQTKTTVKEKSLSTQRMLYAWRASDFPAMACKYVSVEDTATQRHLLCWSPTSHHVSVCLHASRQMIWALAENLLGLQWNLPFETLSVVLELHTNTKKIMEASRPV